MDAHREHLRRVLVDDAARAVIDSLSDEECRLLRLELDRAEREQAARLAQAMEDVLDHVPRMARPRLRRLLIGGPDG